VIDDSFLLMFDASELDLTWTLPAAALRASEPKPWTVELDSALTHVPGTTVSTEATVSLSQRSVLVLRSAA